MTSRYNKLLSFLKRHSTVIRLIVVSVLFTVLFYTVSPGMIIDAYRRADMRFLTIAIAFMAPNILLQIFKWHFVLRVINPRPSLRRAALSVLGGFFLGAGSPGRTGEFARGVYFKGISLVRLASLTIVDKGFNQMLVVIVGFIALSFIVPWPFSLIPLAFDAALLFLLMRLHRLRPVIKRILDRFTHSGMVDNALAAFDALSSETVIGMVIYSLAFYAVYAVQFYITVLAFTDIPAVVALKTIPVVYLVNFLLPISIGDFGVKEAAAVHLLGPFGIQSGPVFAATLLNNVLTFFIPSVVGGILTLLYRPERGHGVPASDDRTDRESAPSHHRVVS